MHLLTFDFCTGPSMETFPFFFFGETFLFKVQGDLTSLALREEREFQNEIIFFSLLPSVTQSQRGS